MPFPSQGHQPRGSRAQVDVRVSPEARNTYLGLVSDSVLPVGSVLTLFFHASSGEPRGREPQRAWQAVYAMHKSAEGWRFLAMDGAGGLDPDNDASACQRCHDGAPADGAFGLPRSVAVASPPKTASTGAPGTPEAPETPEAPKTPETPEAPGTPTDPAASPDPASTDRVAPRGSAPRP